MKRLLQKQRKYPGALLLTLALTLAAFAARADRLTAVRTYDTSAVRLGTRTAPDGTEFRTVEWGDMHPAAEVGSPELPVEHFRFLVPVYSNNFRATVVSATGASALPLGSRVLPAQIPQKADGSPAPAFTYPKAAAYVRTLAPEAWVVDDGFIDGCNHVVTVAVRPVSYDDATLSASAYGSVTVRLDYDLCGEDGLTGSKPIFPPRASEYVRIEDLVVNTANVAQFAPRRVPDAGSGEHSRHYYIIVPDNLKDAVDDLAVWKRQKGYSVVVKTIEDICATPRYVVGGHCSYRNGQTEELVDSAASLRAYLHDEFEDNGAFFCLLVGNSKTSMPIRKATWAYLDGSEVHTFEKHKKNNGECALPTDSYFSDLTQKWNLRKEFEGAVYTTPNGELSYNPDIYIGRLLCSKPDEIANYIYKLILYESNPGRGRTEYLSKALFFEQHSTTIQNGKEIWASSLINNSYLVREVCDSIFEITLLQDHHFTKEPGWFPTGDDVIREMRQHGFSSWHGHGNPYAVKTTHNNHYIKTSLTQSLEELSLWERTEDANSLLCLDNEDFPSIVYSVSCDNAPFDNLFRYNVEFCNINLAEAFTVAGRAGGPAFLGNTRSGSFFMYDSINPTSTGPATGLEKAFILSVKECPKIGIAESMSKLKYVSQYQSCNHNLIGEPEFEMWLGKPEKFDGMCVDYRPDRLEVSCRNLANATMGISFGDGRVSWGGLALREFELRRLDTDFSVSFWKPGYLPYIGLFCFEGEITGQTKKYIVQTATLGNPNYTAESSLGYKPTTIGAGTTYNVRAFESIVVLPNFVIEDGAEVVLDCEKTVELSCTVKAGGKLTVRAKDVKMTPGFNVEKGGESIIMTVE